MPVIMTETQKLGQLLHTHYGFWSRRRNLLDTLQLSLFRNFATIMVGLVRIVTTEVRSASFPLVAGPAVPFCVLT